jgi:hypothetical protein
MHARDVFEKHVPEIGPLYLQTEYFYYCLLCRCKSLGIPYFERDRYNFVFCRNINEIDIEIR